MTKKILLLLLLSGTCFLLYVNHVSATTIELGFYNITNNDDTNAAIGEEQLSVTVTDEGVESGQVLFTFENNVDDGDPNPARISEVYFDDGTLLEISHLIQEEGVYFTSGSASPGNVPGWNEIDPAFAVTQGFLADSSPNPNGVDPGESLGIVFNLINDKDFDDVVDALTLDNEDQNEWLRIGLHVTSIGTNEESEGFVNNPYDDGNGSGQNDPVVPEPATVMLLGIGLLGVARASRRRK